MSWNHVLSTRWRNTRGPRRPSPISTGLPESYARLPGLLEICPFESRLTTEKAATLEALLEQYAPAPA